MAESEVSNEVSKMAVIEKKCGFEKSSCQDLPKPECNGINHHSQHDLDKSYVFVSGDDGLLDVVDNKSVDAEVSSVQPESYTAEAKGKGAELDSRIEKIEAVIGENGIIEHGNGTPPLVNVSIKDVEAEALSVRPESNGTGVEVQGIELDSQLENVGAQPLNEGVNRNTDQSNWDLPLTNDTGAEVSSALPESDAAGVEDQGAELGSQNGNVDAQPLNEAETRSTEQTDGDLPLVSVDNKALEVGFLRVLPESEATTVKDQEAELDSHIANSDVFGGPLKEAETKNIELANGDLALVNGDNKDVEAEVLSVLPESDPVGLKDQGAEFDSQIENSDVVNGKLQLLNEAVFNGDLLLENVESNDVEAEVSSVLPESDPAGVKDQGEELDSQIEKSEFQPLNEIETSSIEQSNEDRPLENVENKEEECEVLSVPESDPVEVEDQGAKSDFQIKKSDGVEFQLLNDVETRNIVQSNGDLQLENVENKVVEAEVSNVLPESDPSGVSKSDFQIKKSDGDEFQLLNDVETRNIEQSNGDLQLENVENKVVEAEVSNVLPESDPYGVMDQGAELENETRKYDSVGGEFQPSLCVLPELDAAEVKGQGAYLENRSVEQSNGDPTLVGDSFWKHEDGEGTQVSINYSLENNTESPAEAKVKLESSLESSDEADIEKAMDQSGKVEIVAEGEESSSGLVGNRESQVVVAELVAESGKNRESNTILLNISSSHCTNGECQDQSNSSVAEASEACQGSQGTVVDVVDCEVNDATADAEDEVDLTRELAEAAESEVSPSTYVDLESYPVHSKDNRLEEAAKTDVPENQLGDSAIGRDIQGLSGQMDESKAVESSSDCHVQTVSDLVFEEKIEDISVSEVNNGVQNPEEIEEQPDRSGLSYDRTPSESTTEASNVQSEFKVSVPETVGAVSSPHIDDPNSQITEKVSDDVKLVANVNKEAVNIELDQEGTDDMRDQLEGTAGIMQENGDTEYSQTNDTSVASAASSSENKSDGKEESVWIETKPFNFLIRSPRFDDENLKEQIRLAKVHVDEKTKLRDAIQIQIQGIRANSQNHGIDYEYAKSEARSARKLVRSKRVEIDSLQSVINKAKNASSIEDIDSQIYNMEHMIQHETLPLKEEKQLIREIKQLKQLREQLSSNMGSQDEVKQAIEKREEFEGRLKILRKELDILKNKVLKAEATAADAEKKYDDENKKVKELQVQFRAADDVRQAAYAQWQNLRKELSKKNEHFFKYKDDATVASNYAFSRDTEALYHLCTNQVENFMEVWNANAEFRREYVKFNARSTVRRFGTLDGRPLGPNEEPPLLPSYSNERVSRLASTPVKADLASQIPSPEVKREISNANRTVDGKNLKKAPEPKYQKVTNEPTVTVQLRPNDGLDISDKELIIEEPPVKSKEEIESLRREEEKRREEVEAKLKEQRRLDALAKAHEARERKKRQAEKLQMRAELKTQKEAEQKEKEREKRLRKKERKKAGVTDGNETNNSCETALSSESAAESSKDMEVSEMSSAATKKSQKPWLFAKQSKTKSVPPPLRNRNKKKLQQWMWVGITSIIILVLFWLGNIGVFSNVALKRRGPIH